METSDGGGIGLDCSVGNIVWVRRRNGSWWPGRILGHEELSESHLMSPRSGTPVKLLGREDASVDWYNLEKSKRVKAFRCGEFDACIERAEASQSIPIKKREKYARREDAILHALELEKKQKLGTTSNAISGKSIGAYKREPITLSSLETYIRHEEPISSGKLSYKCENIHKKVVFSHEGDDNDDPSFLHGGRGNEQFSLENDNAEAIPRMRGLQDFGLKTAQSRRRPSLSSSWENSCKSVENHIDSLSSSGYIMEGADQASTSRNDMLVKRKRSYGGVIDEFLVKKRDRRRPLLQVLESSAKLPPISYQPNFSTSKTEETDKMGSTWRAKRSRCVYLPADLDEHPELGGYTSEHMLASTNHFELCSDINYSGNVDGGYTPSCLIEVADSDCCEGHLLEEESDMLIDSTDILLPGSKDCDPSEFQVSGGFRSLIQEDVPLSGFLSQLHGQPKDTSSEAGVSKWRMKGKRNIRNVGKRPMDACDIKSCCADLDKCSGSISSTCENKDSLKFGIEEPSNQRIQGRGFYPIKEEFENPHYENDLVDRDLDQNELAVYGNMRIPGQSIRNRCSLNDSDEDSHGLNPSIWEPSNVTCNPLWEESVNLFDQVYVTRPDNEMEPLLVNVDLKVQTSYQGEHVPLVSLMSRLNGKAIIGHPIQIEILEDGCASHLVLMHDAVLDESAAPQAMWRTARRTAMQRVPRSIPLMTALEEEDPDLFQNSGRETKTPLHKEAYYHYLKHQVRPAKKRVSLLHQSALRKFQKKNAKRLSLSSKKTRTLSSLASDEKLSGECDGHKLDGLIKTEDSVPLVTCVPVKVVFSRILEAVGRSPSMEAHRVITSSPGRTP